MRYAVPTGTGQSAPLAAEIASPRDNSPARTLNSYHGGARPNRCEPSLVAKPLIRKHRPGAGIVRCRTNLGLLVARGRFYPVERQVLGSLSCGASRPEPRHVPAW